MKSLFIGDKKVLVPIIQGGMGVGVSLWQLASAVANEGGVGVISTAGLGLLYKEHAQNYLQNSIYGLKEELRKARNSTNGVIGVNIMVALSNYGDMVRTAIEENVDIIFSGAGLPMDLPSYLHEGSHTLLAPIVSSARAAKIICEKWNNSYQYLPDMIIVEGPKAGGHLGFKEAQIHDEDYSLEHLLPEVLGVVSQYSSLKNIPVVAAGGISTGEDICTFLQLGATAVQMGSIFVPTLECDASDAFKQVYVRSNQDDTVIIESPVGMPGRAFNSPFIQRANQGQEVPKNCAFHCIKTCDYKKSPYCIIKALYNAAKGDLSKGYAFAGHNAYQTKRIRSVKEVFAQLKQEFLLSRCAATI